MISKIYVLHHKPLVERKLFLSEKLKKINFEIEWVENFLPEEIDYEKELKNWSDFEKVTIRQHNGFYENFAKKISISELSLYLKHKFCFEEQIKNNYENILIIEDDVEIPDFFQEYLDSNLQEFEELKKTHGVGILILGTAFHFRSKNIRQDKKVYYDTLNKTRCTHAILHNINTSKKIIKRLENPNLPIDFKLNEIIEIENIGVAWSEPGLRQLSGSFPNAIFKSSLT